MRQFLVRKKTGFKNLNPLKPIVIRDFRGKIFYSTEGLKPVEKFNLPPGNYYIDTGSFRAMKNPVKYKLNKLPPAQRNLKPPTNFNVTFGFNPNKCTIKWGEGLIIYDDALKEATLPVLWFMLFHEYGHSLYSTERYADLLSANLMKKRGFNPSQIGKAPITSLSSRQLKRKKFLTNKLISQR